MTSGGLAHDSGLNLVGAVISQLCNFGILFLLARGIGQAAVGAYSQAFALRALLVLLCGLGMRIAMTKFVAASIARGESGMVVGSVRLGMVATVGLAVLGSVALFLSADALAVGFFSDPAMVIPLQLAAVSLPFLMAMTTALAATQGFRTMRAFAGVGLIGEPATRLVLTGVAVAAGFGVLGAMGALVVASAVGAALAIVALRRYLQPHRSTPPVHPVARLASFAGASWVASVANQGLLWADIVILGAFVSSSEVGIYQVATRITLLATFAIAPLTAAFAPRVAHLWEHADRTSLARQYVQLTSWTWRLSLPVLTVLLLVPGSALRMFGEGFDAGTSTVVILAVGALAETLAAPSAVVLNQIGRNRLNMVLNVLALGIDVGLNLVLIPVLGIQGAAMAWAIALVVPGGVRVISVRRIATGVAPWSRVHAAAAVAALVAGLVAWPVTQALAARGPLALLAGSATVAGVYGPIVLAFATRPEEREAARAVARRVARRISPLSWARRLHARIRLSRLPVGPRPIRVVELISPLRYDILVRAGFFQFAREHNALRRDDFPAFLQLASKTPYRTWFDLVAVESIGFDPSDPAASDAAFERRVRRSLALLDAYEQHGFDSRYPVTVGRLPAGQSLDGRAFVEDRHVPIDGCHRLALLHLDGRTFLAPQEYRLDRHGVLRGNTSVLVNALGLPENDYSWFVSWGQA